MYNNPAHHLLFYSQYDIIDDDINGRGNNNESNVLSIKSSMYHIHSFKHFSIPLLSQNLVKITIRLADV